MANRRLLRYTISSPLRSFLGLAQRRAIYPRRDSDHQAQNDLLRTLWITQIEKLNQSDWDFVESSRNQMLLMNCPPAGVLVEEYKHTSCCRFRLICPFCWARDTVKDVFDALKSVIEVNDISSLLITTRRHYISNASKFMVPANFQAEARKHRKREYLAVVKPVGGIVLAYLVPISGGVEYVRKTMILLNDSSVQPVDWGDLAVQHVDRIHSRKSLSFVSSSFAKYPQDLLHCSGLQLKNILQLMQGQKIVSWLGKLRG